ncbi:MAG: MinD/ParA family protein [Desulfonatronovibrionaceae bacterium]
MKKYNTYSLSVMSGKGGVGKTNLCLNLAYALYANYKSAILMDCDLGLANLDVLLGISPEKNMQDLLQGEADPGEIVLSLEKNGLDLLPAASGVPELVELDEDLQGVLLEKLNRLFSAYEFLLLDLGAGINNSVLSFARMTHERIVIITPEPTSLTDSYALIKVLSSKYGLRHFYLLVNMVDSDREAKLGFERMKVASEKFLGVTCSFLGAVHNDPNLPLAVRDQRAFIKNYPDSRASKDIRTIADRILALRGARAEDLDRAPVLSLGNDNVY